MALTERSLLEAAELAGLRTHTLVTRFMPYSTKGRLPAAPWLVRAYLSHAACLVAPREADALRRCRRLDGRRSADPTPTLSVVMPVFKEGESVEPVLRALTAAISAPHEILVVYDFDEDPTVPVIERLAGELPAVRGLRNDLGRGVLNAMKAGIAESRGPYVLISMADGSDEPHVVDPMVALAVAGADVVSASRYMRGGHQIGGPPLKRLMSRTAGLTLHWFAGVPTHDPTNNFKLYCAALPRHGHDREHGRLRAGARADGQGHDRPPPRRRGPDDLARPDGRREQLQAPQVAAALPALVSGGLRSAAAAPAATSQLTGQPAVDGHSGAATR